MSKAIKGDLLIFGGLCLPPLAWGYGIGNGFITIHGDGIRWVYPTFLVMLLCCRAGTRMLREELAEMSRGPRVVQGLVLGIGGAGLAVAIFFSVFGLPAAAMDLAAHLGY